MLISEKLKFKKFIYLAETCWFKYFRPFSFSRLNTQRNVENHPNITLEIPWVLFAWTLINDPIHVAPSFIF